MLFRSVRENSKVSPNLLRPKSVWSKHRPWWTDKDRKTYSVVSNLMLNSISKLIIILKTNFFYILNTEENKRVFEKTIVYKLKVYKLI